MSQRTKTILLWAVIGVILLLAVICSVYAQTPTPIPLFDINKVDFSKITQEDIDKTIAHRKLLDQKGVAINEKQAVVIDTQATALANATKNLSDLQGQITLLATHDRKMTDQVAADQTQLAKKDSALLRRDGIILILVIAIGVFLFIKYGKYLSFL